MNTSAKRRRRRALALAVAAIGAVVIGGAVLSIVDHVGDPRSVAWMLNIPAPPQSLRVFDCESGPLTDVVITCAVQIDPREFPLLLKGYAFSSEPSKETNYSLGAPKIGPDFDVETEYKVEPTSFKDGGSVRVFVDADKRHAIVDLYIE